MPGCYVTAADAWLAMLPPGCSTHLREGPPLRSCQQGWSRVGELLDQSGWNLVKAAVGKFPENSQILGSSRMVLNCVKENCLCSAARIDMATYKFLISAVVQTCSADGGLCLTCTFADIKCNRCKGCYALVCRVLFAARSVCLNVHGGMRTC